jgi:hypothetical protein
MSITAPWLNEELLDTALSTALDTVFMTMDNGQSTDSMVSEALELVLSIWAYTQTHVVNHIEHGAPHSSFSLFDTVASSVILRMSALYHLCAVPAGTVRHIAESYLGALSDDDVLIQRHLNDFEQRLRSEVQIQLRYPVSYTLSPLTKAILHQIRSRKRDTLEGFRSLHTAISKAISHNTMWNHSPQPGVSIHDAVAVFADAAERDILPPWQSCLLIETLWGSHEKKDTVFPRRIDCLLEYLKTSPSQSARDKALQVVVRALSSSSKTDVDYTELAELMSREECLNYPPSLLVPLVTVEGETGDPVNLTEITLAPL